MIRIESERDPERLRQIALLLRAENDRLHSRLAELARQLAEARGEDAVRALQLELKLLQEQLAARNRTLFGASSERRSRPADDGQPKDEARARRGHGPRQQPQLPLVEHVHVLDEPDRACPKCGGDLREWQGQFEDSEEIDVVERSFRIVRHRRQKYTCRCGECVETALGPPKLIPGGRYSVDFAVAVAVAKYADHLPLERQVKQMGRLGLEVDSQTLWDQIHALWRHLDPTAQALHRLVLSAPVIAADETRWPLLDRPGSSKWWAWSVASPEAISYRIEDARSAQAAARVFGDYAGCVVCDGYGVYPALRETRIHQRAGPVFVLAHCWAHGRRKLIEAEPHYPKATEAIDLIRKLYEIEARARESGADVAEMRRTESAPVVEAIRQWLVGTAALPKSSLGKAITYMLGLWEGLTRFLSDPAIPLDSNSVERGMRPVAVGRKNHYGSKSERGTRVAALFYTLIESAKLVGVEPAAYLAEATRRAISNPGTVTLPRDLLDG